jgi:Protein of unknown function (DUF3093)
MPPTDVPQPAAGGYRETLTVPVSWWLLGSLFAIAVGWAFLVSTPPPVPLLAFVVAVAIVGYTLGRYGSAQIVVDADGLRAAGARLPWPSIGSADALDAESTRKVLGVDADARAYLLVRVYCGGSVKVTLDDDVDPTPYWLVSTRHATALAERLRRGAMQD